jgi:hypothetical protein
MDHKNRTLHGGDLYIVRDMSLKAERGSDSYWRRISKEIGYPATVKKKTLVVQEGN